VRYNRARTNPANRIIIPIGFNPDTARVGGPARSLLRSMQKVSGLEATGRFDEATLRKLFPPSLRGKVMAIAHSQLGVHEWPSSSNSGPVRKYLEAAGYPWAGAWCAAFVTWCLLKAGFKRSQLPSGAASVAAWLDHAKAHDCLKPIDKSALGDLWVWGFGGNPHAHIGFCDDTRPADQVAYGLDGNVGAYGGSVTQVSRSAGQITACIDLVKLSRVA
jgi:hypothetical protein